MSVLSRSLPLNLKKPEFPPRGRVTLALSGALLALVLLASAVQLGVTDFAFAHIDFLLKRGDLPGAVEQYHFARRWKFFGSSPDLGTPSRWRGPSQPFRPVNYSS